MVKHPVVEHSRLSANTRDLLTIAGGIAAIGGVYYVYTLIKKPVSRAVQTVVGTHTAGHPTTVPVTPHTVIHTQTHTVLHTATPHQTPAHTPVSTPTHTSRAPQKLPAYVTRRCGTVYVSLGLWSPHRAGLAYIAKYTNGTLVAQYPQPESSGSPWLTAGTWSGGYACAGSGSGSGGGSTYPNAPYWTNLGNGCYRAQSGATLSGLAAALGTNYQTLASINHISNPNAIPINQTVCAQGSGSGSGSGGSGVPPQLVIESGAVS